MYLVVCGEVPIDKHVGMIGIVSNNHLVHSYNSVHVFLRIVDIFKVENSRNEQFVVAVGEVDGVGDVFVFTYWFIWMILMYTSRFLRLLLVCWKMILIVLR